MGRESTFSIGPNARKCEGCPLGSRPFRTNEPKCPLALAISSASTDKWFGIPIRGVGTNSSTEVPDEFHLHCEGPNGEPQKGRKGFVAFTQSADQEKLHKSRQAEKHRAQLPRTRIEIV